MIERFLVKISKKKKKKVHVSYRSSRALTQNWGIFNIPPCLFPMNGSYGYPQQTEKPFMNCNLGKGEEPN